jgi:cell division protein FtsB
METKKFDIKTWAIIILGAALCISFWFGQKNNIGDNKDEIQALHENNDSLKKSNDSLRKANTQIDAEIAAITKILNANDVKLAATQIELDKLKKRKNETFTHVTNMSANGVSNAFTDYLNTKSPNHR